MDLIRIGMVSAGGMANHHARMILQRDDCKVVSMCDPSAPARDRLRATLGVAAPGVTDYETPHEMIAKEQLDAVVITTPHTQHEEQVKLALNAGLHVLVEKPMATTTAAARNMMATAEQTGKVLAIAYQRHGEGKFIRARQLIEQGVIGDVRLIHVVIAQDCLHIFQPGASWRADPAWSGGGHFMDTGSHINDMMLWTTGLEPKHVFAFINNEGCLVDVVTAVSIEFTNGGLGNMSFISMSAEDWREEFTFYGTAGVMRFGHAEPLRYQRKGEDTILPRPAPGGKPPLPNFIEAIQGQAEVQAPPVCGLRVVQLTETAYKSAQSGRPEMVG